MFECKLVASKRQTAFGPLCLLGHYLSQEGKYSSLSVASTSSRRA